MRVAFVDSSGQPGGGQLGLARYLAGKHRNDAFVLVLGGGDAFESVSSNHVIKLCTSKRRWSFLRCLPRLRMELKSLGAEAVIANSGKAALAVALVSWSLRSVKIYYARSDLLRERMGFSSYWLLRLALSRFDAVISNSRWTDSTLPPALARLPRSIAYPVCGVDGRSESTPSSLDGECQGLLRVLSLSRIARWKGTDVLVDAIEKLNQAGWQDRISLRLAGTALYEDAAFETEIQNRVSNGIPNIEFLGHVNDVSALIGESDVLVLASVHPEPFGQVVVQGMAAGKIVVATNHGGPMEVIDSGVSGLLVPPGNSVELARTLEWIATHPSERGRISTEARLAAAHYSDDAMIEMLEAGIDKCCNQAATVASPIGGRAPYRNNG